MPQNAAKSPSPPPQTSITESEAPPTVCANLSLQDHGDVQTLSPPCQSTAHAVLPQFSLRLNPMPCRHNNGHTSTLSKSCTCGVSTGFSSVLSTTTGMSPQCNSARPRTLTLNIQSAKRHANVTQLVSIFSSRIAHDPIPTLTCIFAPTNDRDDMVSALSENCNCGTSTVFCTVKPKHLSLRVSQPVKELHLANLRSFCTVCIVHPCLCESNRTTTLSKN